MGVRIYPLGTKLNVRFYYVRLFYLFRIIFVSWKRVHVRTTTATASSPDTTMPLDKIRTTTTRAAANNNSRQQQQQTTTTANNVPLSV